MRFCGLEQRARSLVLLFERRRDLLAIRERTLGVFPVERRQLSLELTQGFDQLEHPIALGRELGLLSRVARQFLVGGGRDAQRLEKRLQPACDRFSSLELGARLLERLQLLA